MRDPAPTLDLAEGLYRAEVLGRYEAIRINHAHSLEVLARTRDAFAASSLATLDGLVSVGVCGSYARLEGSGSSDMDVLVVVSDDLPDEEATRVHGQVVGLMGDLGHDAPNPRGVFAAPTRRSRLLTIAGASLESYQDLSKRVLMLLESTPILYADRYVPIVDGLVDVYAQDVIESGLAVEGGRRLNKNFVFLLNDVRYFRTICVNYQWTTSETEDGKWPIRNVKLRHSRVLIYMSMVASLGCLSDQRDGDKVDLLKRLVALEPLRRLHACYELSGDPNFFRVAGFYDVFLRSLNRPKVRDTLTGIEYQDRYANADFTVLKANSDAFAAELLRFVMSKRGIWTDRFFEYLLF